MRLIYREKESAFSSLSEAVRITVLLVLFVLSVLLSSIQLQLVVLAATLVTAASAGVTAESLLLARYVVYLSSFILLISVFLAPGGRVLLSLPLLHITSSPVLYSLSMLIRILGSVIALNLLLLTVNPDALLAIISRFGRKTAASLLVATRLMPVLANDGEEVLQAFESKGLSLRSGGWRERAYSASRMVFPLLYSTMDRSLSVAEAMEARGFPARWRMRRSTLRRADCVQLAMSFAALIYAFFLAFTGSGVANYYSAAPFAIQFVPLLLLAILTFPLIPFLGRWSHHRDKGPDVQVQFQ